MLVHHPDSSRDRGAWARELLDHPINENFALIRLIKPREHIHQGTFASTIFTD